MRTKSAFGGVVTCIPALGIALLAACDPCAGTSGCRDGDHISYVGHIVEHASGRSVGGVPVTFIRTSGVSIAIDTLRAISDGAGFFHLETTTSASGDVIGTIHVAPPGRDAYDMAGVVMHTTRVGGDGGDLGRLVVDPYIQYIAELRNRRKNDGVVMDGAVVSFKRTGGIPVVPDSIQMVSDTAGRFLLAPTAVHPGVMTGYVNVAAPGERVSYNIPLTIETRYFDTPNRQVDVLNIGFALVWAGEIHRRASNAHQANIQVDVRRTGGVLVDPAQFTTQTNDIGLFPIQPLPANSGDAFFELTIHPPSPFSPFVISNVRVFTTADDTVRLAGAWGWGAQAFGAIELRYRTTMTSVAPGAQVIFRRTSGIAVRPDTFVDAVNQFGFAKVQLPADASGDVVGDFEIRLGEPYGTEFIRGVHLPSAEEDTQRFYGTHLVGRWFPQVGQVLDSASQRPIPGARVTFTRVDGVQFAPNPYVVTPNADGYFALRPQPLADGDVVGNITFDLPAPYSQVVIRGIHLHTSMDDTLRLVGSWLVAKPH